VGSPIPGVEVSAQLAWSIGGAAVESVVMRSFRAIDNRDPRGGLLSRK
jgi:hypothetical protein